MKQIAKALLQVTSEVNEVKKTGYNDHFKYKFASDQDVLNAVRSACTNAGLHLIPVKQDIINIREIGNKLLYDISAHYQILHISGESITFSVLGSGIDTQDKALPKALTMCLKYAYIQLFSLPRGHDPDKTEHSQIDEKMLTLDVDFRDKDQVKVLGARWNKVLKKWQCYESQKEKFTKWMIYDPELDDEFQKWSEPLGGYDNLATFFKKRGWGDIKKIGYDRVKRFQQEVDAGNIEIVIECLENG